MKQLKTWMIALVGFCVGVLSVTAATDGTWNWASTATPDGRSPEAAADWNETANWVGGALPSGSTATAFLVPKDQADSLANAGARYIRVPDEGVDIGEINIRKNATVYLTGGPVRFGTSSTQSSSSPRVRDEGTTCTASYYSSLDFSRKATTFNKARFCGPVIWPTTGVLASSHYLHFCANAWATNTLTAVTNPFPETTFSPGSGSVQYRARMSAPATTCAWRTFRGSPVLRRIGARHDLAAGATVSGDNIPAGAFVTRIYASDAIEISAPCTDDSGAEGVTVSFGAFSPAVTVQHVKKLNNQSADVSKGISWIQHVFFKAQPEDVFDVTVDDISPGVLLTTTPNSAGDGPVFAASTTVTNYPARIFLKSAKSANGFSGVTKAFQVMTAHVVFSPEDGQSFLLKDLLVGGNSAASLADNDTLKPRLETPAGVTTTVENIRWWSYSVFTCGAGTFDVSSTNAHHNALTVEAGTVAFRAKCANGTPDFAKLSVKEGAVFRLAEGALKFNALAFQPGAVIVAEAGTTVDLSSVASCAGLTLSGPGTFILPSASATEGATLVGTPVFRFVKQGGRRDVIVDEPVTPGVVGHPAFWVDAAKNVTKMSFTWTDYNNVFKEYANGVSCWRDCRDGETTYYATNDWSDVGVGSTPCVPGRTGTASNKAIIEFNGISYPGQSNYRNAWSGMVWNRPITNVCAVFSVYVRDSGGQAALGSTKRFTEMGTARTSNDFMRGVHGGTSGGGIGTPANYVLDVDAAARVKDGWIFVNGTKKTATDNVPSGTFALVELHPLAPYGRADAFAIQENNGVTCSGCQKLAETIVYTNELTMAERRRVCAYLTAKYGITAAANEISDNRFLGDADLSAVPADAPFGVDVASGKVEGRAALGSTTFVKTGEGVCFVDYVNGTALDVRGGTLEVRSCELTEDVIPGGYFVHLDACDTNRMTLVDKQYPDGVTRPMVRNWRPKNPEDGVGAQKRTTDSRYEAPYLAYPAALEGKPVVDFGELHNGSTDYKGLFLDYVTAESADGAAMSYATATKVGSLFVMVGSRNGGGIPFSHFDTKPWRDVTSDPSVPFFNTTAPSNLRTASAGRINGEKVTLTEAGLNGGYQVVSARANASQDGNIRAINVSDSRKYVGGGEVGEILIYETPLDGYSHQLVDRYLNWKWLGIGFPGYRPSVAGAVTVAAGATLRVAGGAPLEVTSLSGAGTVEGAIAFANGTEIDVTIENGAVAGVTVTGDVDFSKGGTVVVHGDAQLLDVGDYPLVTATAADFGEGTWTLDVETPHRSRVLALRQTATGLVLGVAKSGVLLIVR